MNNHTYLKDYDDFDQESQKILSQLRGSLLSEQHFSKNKLSKKSSQAKNLLAEAVDSTLEITNWSTDEYIDLELLIVKIKSANRGISGYQFIYNSQDLKGNIQNKTIEYKNSFIRLKVYRNPDIGNVSVKWNNVRVTQKINPEEKKIYYRLHFYYADNQETAFVLETYSYQEFRDLNILLNYGDIDQYEADYNYFRQNFAHSLRNETIAERLEFIYENIPESILTNFSNIIDTDIFFDHLDILSVADDSDIFRDSSTAIIQIFKAFGNPIPILNYYRENPAKLNRIYYNLDKSSVYNGRVQKNRMILANIMLVFSMFSKNTKQKKIAKTFTVGKGYKINSNILEGGIFQQDGDNYRDTFFLQQQKVEQQNVKVVPKEGDPNAKETTTINLDEGEQYHPLDMVYIKDINGEKEVSYFVPAIYLKALADEQEWEVVTQNIRIAADLIAIVIGVLTLPAGNPYFFLLAAADIALAGADLTIQAFREEIIKYEGGKEFLDAWDEIYAAGGALMGGALLVTALYKVGLKLIVLPEVIKNINLQNTIKTCMLNIFLELNISNFQGNTIKILTQNSEIITATSGALNEFKVKRLFERECFLVSGNVVKNEKSVEEFALVYKGEIIAQGNKTEFYQQIKGIGKDIYSDSRLTELLEMMYKNGGIPFLKGYSREKILAIPKGERPDPFVYLPKEYIAKHLKKFEDEIIASRVVLKKSFEKYGLGKPDEWQSEFVSLKSDIDKVISDANGSLEFIALELGFPVEQIRNDELLRVDFKLSTKNKTFMPSGNEFGTNEQWLPGGKLPTGKLEAIISLKEMIKGKDFVVSTIKLK